MLKVVTALWSPPLPYHQGEGAHSLWLREATREDLLTLRHEPGHAQPLTLCHSTLAEG
jgi:hypothetical protein